MTYPAGEKQNLTVEDLLAKFARGPAEGQFASDRMLLSK